MTNLSAFLVASGAVVAVLLGWAASPVTPNIRFPSGGPSGVDIGDGESAIKRLSGALQCPTIADAGADNHISNPGPFQDLHSFLERSFPVIWKKLEVQRVRKWSLRIKWAGQKPALPAVVYISHLDVVPATSEERWTHPPFSGVVADGFIWGRGTLDTKQSALGLLEAVTSLLETGFVPQRTLYLAFGHDEEVGGLGAEAIAKTLADEGVQLDCIFDEGGVILADGFKPFTKVSVALIGTAEKGFSGPSIEVRGQGGHASMMPDKRTAPASVLARIICALDAAPPPARLVQPTIQLLQTLGSAAGVRGLRWLLSSADVWPVSHLLAWAGGQLPGEVSAFMRTTAVLTGITTHPAARNVVPSTARASFNFRLLPGEDPEFPVRYLEAAAAKERRGGADVSVEGGRESAAMGPSGVSPTDGRHFPIIGQAIMETLAGPEGLVVSPWLLTARTDSGHYRWLPGAENTFRFNPMRLNRTGGDPGRIHGIDERISVRDYLDGIAFYARLMQLLLAS